MSGWSMRAIALASFAILAALPSPALASHGDFYGYASSGYAFQQPSVDRSASAYAGAYDPPPPPLRYRNRGYRNADYGPPGGDRPPPRYRCDRGTGGTIIGAIAGGLLGNGVAGRSDRTAGTLIGAGVGALAGRAVDRSC